MEKLKELSKCPICKIKLIDLDKQDWCDDCEEKRKIDPENFWMQGNAFFEQTGISQLGFEYAVNMLCECIIGKDTQVKTMALQRFCSDVFKLVVIKEGTAPARESVFTDPVYCRRKPGNVS